MTRSVLMRNRTDLHPTHRAYGKLVFALANNGALVARYQLNEGTIFPSETAARHALQNSFDRTAGWRVKVLGVSS